MENLLRTLLKIHETGAPTFHHNNGTSESKIDMFVSSSCLKITSIHQFCTLDTPLNLSSHDPITTKVHVQVNSEKQKSEFSSTYSKFKQDRIIWDESKLTEYLAGKALSDAAGQWDTPETTPLKSVLQAPSEICKLDI